MGYILRIEDHSFSIVSQSQSDQERAHWHRDVAPSFGWLLQTATPADKAKANSEKSETQATANKKKTEAQSDAVKAQASANEN
jgi:hypothetical protein